MKTIYNIKSLALFIAYEIRSIQLMRFIGEMVMMFSVVIFVNGFFVPSNVKALCFVGSFLFLLIGSIITNKNK